MAAATDAAKGVQYKKISSKIIPGVLHAQNKGAFHWGWQGLIAYGCQSHVVIVDSPNAQIVQTLDKHQSNVTKVKWDCHQFNQTGYHYELKLASADASGVIIVWNVKEGKDICSFSDGNKAVLDIQWLMMNDSVQDMLAALHPPYSFIIWNTRTGTKLWKKTYTESLLAFSFDPFCVSNMAFLGQDCLILVDDFTLNKVPSSNGRKLYVSCPSVLSGNTVSSTSSSGSEDKSRNRDKIMRKVRLLAGSDNTRSKSEESAPPNDCIDFGYHPACHHHLLLVYPQEILILDLEINQTVGIISTERHSAPFLEVLPCTQRDAVCCLHENGMISLHARQKAAAHTPSFLPTSHSPDGYMEIMYDVKAQSDPIRLTKMHRVVSLTLCPRTETSFALLTSDGRIFILDLILRQQNILCPIYSLADLLAPVYGPVDSSGPPLKFLLSGVIQNVTAAIPLVIRMCPPLTTKNWTVYQPLMAAGSTTGLIQIFDMAAGMLHKELTVHTYPVRGIEWVSLTSFLSFAHQNTGNNIGHVRNELFMTDVQTGKSKVFRSENQDESPIEMIRVSQLKQYFIVAFKEDPFELWDIRSLTLLRAMPRRFPNINALEWAPIPSLKSLKKRMSVVDSGLLGDVTVPVPAPLGIPTSGLGPSLSTAAASVQLRENFVFVDTDGHIYQFSVEGSVIKDGNKLPPESGIGSITTISWKGDQIVMGDVDGNLSLWDLKSKSFTVAPTHRGWIRRVRFAPGRGNMKVLVLFNDGVDIWDVRDIKLFGQIRCPRDMPRVEDADWAASDKPVLVTGDGCVRIMDFLLKGSTSPIADRECFAPVWCPSLVPIDAHMRTLMLHSKQDQGKRALANDQTEIVKSHFQVLDRDFRDAFTNQCPLFAVHHFLLMARLLGDEAEVTFWQVALYYLRLELNERAQRETAAPGKSAVELCEQCDNVHLDCNYDVLCNADTYKKIQFDRLALHENKRSCQEHARRCAETLILFRQIERAVQHLLETDPGHESFYTDCLRACVVASVGAPGLSQSTIKLVATNLIAQGHLSEGVQLLCLIDKGLDACRYLQTYGQWDRAMWLAKTTLTNVECLEVAKRWIDHLISPQVEQKSKAVLVMLSLREFVKVLEMLLSFSYVDRAALFAEVCQELGVFQLTDTSSQLVKDVYLKYARLLWSESSRELAMHYATKAGAAEEFVGKEVKSAVS